ncbi:M28 family peptidase [Baaleninema simplex]|uniref:M28 family peptidase n=1 Tax=Baaleninema simplex TaxID=2862350 RepID=UPI00034844BB|nr:M28 family peptidase [Baaleninema simplex]
MPGTSHSGPLPPLTPEEIALRDRLKADIERISANGEHNYIAYDNLLAVADFIEDEFAKAEYEVRSQAYDIEGQTFRNLEVERLGTETPESIVIVGAHYDSVVVSPGANDNGSGVAAILALARAFAHVSPKRTLRFVAFANEEPPFFQTEEMGSVVYAKRCRQSNENIVAMLCLETIGYYDDAPGSQNYPMGLLENIYPITGNFLSVVGNLDSAFLVRQVVGEFRDRTQFPCEGAILPGSVAGAGWSDHWAFWQYNYPAVMVTDTAPFRYPYYHTAEDTPDKVDFDRLARVVMGLQRTLDALVNA